MSSACSANSKSDEHQQHLTGLETATSAQQQLVHRF